VESGDRKAGGCLDQVAKTGDLSAGGFGGPPAGGATTLMVITVINHGGHGGGGGGIGSIFSSAIDQVDKALSSTIASTATPVSIAQATTAGTQSDDRQPDS